MCLSPNYSLFSDFGMVYNDKTLNEEQMVLYHLRDPHSNRLRVSNVSDGQLSQYISSNSVIITQEAST